MLVPALYANVAALAGAAAGTPLTSTLTDNFNDNSIDGAKWTTGQLKDPSAFTAGVTVAEANSRAEITPPTTAALTYSGYLSVNTYDFTNSSVVVKLSNAGSLDGRQEVYLSVGPSTSNHYGWVLSAGAVYIQQVKAGVITNPSNFPYLTVNPAWLRLRYDGTNVYVDTALAGASNPPVSGDWTNQLSMAWDAAISLTSCFIGFGSGTWDSVASPITVQFDGLNTAT